MAALWTCQCADPSSHAPVAPPRGPGEGASIADSGRAQQRSLLHWQPPILLLFHLQVGIPAATVPLRHRHLPWHRRPLPHSATVQLQVCARKGLLTRWQRRLRHEQRRLAFDCVVSQSRPFGRTPPGSSILPPVQIRRVNFEMSWTLTVFQYHN